MPTILSPQGGVTASGTTLFNLDLAQTVEEAYERAGGEMRTGYDLRTARRSLNLLFADWANRGLNMWTFEQKSIPLLANTPTYSLPTDTVDVLDMYLRTTVNAVAQDTALNRMALPQYDTLPNKAAMGRPTQVFIQRAATPQLTVWPVAPASNVYTLMYWRLRRIQDAGDGDSVQDIPFRLLPAMVAGLAYYLALKLPDGAGLSRLDVLKQQYDEAWQNASDEDREKASVRLVPRRGLR